MHYGDERSISKSLGPTLRCQLMGEFGPAAIRGLTARIEEMELEQGRGRIGLREFNDAFVESATPETYRERFNTVFRLLAEHEEGQMRRTQAELDRRGRPGF